MGDAIYSWKILLGLTSPIAGDVFFPALGGWDASPCNTDAISVLSLFPVVIEYKSLSLF